MFYKIVAEKDGETVTVERNSLLITTAKARVLASEGWTVVITDRNGKTLSASAAKQVDQLEEPEYALNDLDRHPLVPRQNHP
jgi:NADP-dependent 3-hydroxy acid dehydrogenase YdfG